MNLKEKRDVKYLNKDFTDFRENLKNYVQIYFKDTITDFDPSDPASLFLDLSSYVGDVLSFYLDTGIKENLLLIAEEKKNVSMLAQALGYKPKPTVPAKGSLDVYQLVPAIGTGASVAPDYNYALTINAGMQIKSQDTDIIFRTKDEVNFAFSSSYDPRETTIYQTDESGTPAYYLLKKSVEIEAGSQKTINITVTNPEKFYKILIPDTNVISIDEIKDSDNNIWTEVDYLAQDTVFESVPNVQKNDDSLYQYQKETPYLLKFKRVPRRFITKYRSDNKLEIQFGSGVSNDYDEEILPNPDNVGLATPTGISKLNYSWDVANFLFSDAYGQVPSNTILTIKYSVGGGIKSNVLPNTLNNVIEISYGGDTKGLDVDLLNTVKQSIACNNPGSATGGRDAEEVEEIRQNALSYFAAQGRIVTEQDYIIRAYSMPQKFGSIAKAYITKDEQLSFYQHEISHKNPLALDLYILTFNPLKQLTQANDAIKENLKNYLNRYRILTDSINIKDAYIINIQIFFDITSLPDYSAKQVLLNCISNLKEFFNIDRWQINQPIVKTDIVRLLASTEGVQSVLGVIIQNIYNDELGYSPNYYPIDQATRNDVIYPSLDPSIFEVRFPDSDLIGRVAAY